MQSRRRLRRDRIARVLLLAGLGGLAAPGCAHSGGVHGAVPPPAPPPPRIFFYPARGQSPERQDRDRYECHRWAIRESGFDPSLPQAPPAEGVAIIPSRPIGADTFAGAAAGALIGGVADHSGEGAAIGAAIGAAAGAVSDIHRAHGRRALQRSLEARLAVGQGRRGEDYHRAMSACLEGRGYAVG